MGLPLKTNYLTFLDFVNHLVNTFFALFWKVLTSKKFLRLLKVIYIGITDNSKT